MKKRKINLKMLSLQKQTIASVNAQSIQGGTNITLLETQLVIICATTFTVGPTIPVTLSEVKTKCITCPGFGCPSENGKTCPGPITYSALC
ncbi:hypothetical protein [Kordia sp.]|uniref:hypothetical protein n=1 Tax=Kordia sp. TaxID=1965332 RepID=UPI003D6ADB39